MTWQNLPGRKLGVPVGEFHQQLLEEVASKLPVEEKDWDFELWLSSAEIQGLINYECYTELRKKYCQTNPQTAAR